MRRLSQQTAQHPHASGHSDRRCGERGAPRSMKPLTILIVDDLPVNLKLLRAQLEGEGHAVVEAHNGVEALEVLDRQKAGVIISDILMPTMDGDRPCYEVRRSTLFRHLPFIFSS